MNIVWKSNESEHNGIVDIVFKPDQVVEDFSDDIVVSIFVGKPNERKCAVSPEVVFQFIKVLVEDLKEINYDLHSLEDYELDITNTIERLESIMEQMTKE